MSTPGSFSVPSKGTDQLVNAAGNVDGGTLLWFTDAAQSIDGDRFPLPTGDTHFELQLQCVFSSDIPKRPTWVQVELCRITKSGSTTFYDTTGKARRAIVQPGTTTWADTFDVSEFVNADDGLFGWTVTHNATAPIRVEVDIFKAKNEKASVIHKLGGFNQWSDGTVR